jgi:hypothetical protein
VRPDASLAQASRGYNDVSSARHRAQFKQLEAAGGIRRRPFFVIATVAVEAGGSQGQPASRTAKLRGYHSRHAGSFTEGVMQKFLVSILAIVALSVAFLADAVAAHPPGQIDRR